MSKRSALLPLFSSLALSAPALATGIEGYAWPPSVAQGDTVSFYVSTEAPTFDIELLREGWTSVAYLEVDGIPGMQQAIPDSAWQGCDWELSHALVIPLNWTSGVYVARLIAPGAPASHAIFTVKEDDPGSTARVLLQCSVATWQAYNSWGGKCFYDWLSSNDERAHVLSFRRPYSPSQGRGSFPNRELPVIVWLEQEGYAVEYCTDLDIHADPTLETHYDLLLVAGHSEYWSKQMRDNVEDRVAAGRDVAFFGGNNCWWQIRYGPELDRIVCYKNAGLDPLSGVQDSLVTVRWHEPPVNRPTNELTGVSTRGGGYPGEPMPYVVEQAGHWAFEGTGVSNGEPFGEEAGVARGEVDGAAFERVDGFPVVTGEDGTPLQFEILATAEFTGGYSVPPYDEGTATMGAYEQDGTVFTASSLGWAGALGADPVTARISENVIGRMVDGNPFRAEAGVVALEDVSWSTLGTAVTFALSFRNTSLSVPSRGVHGTLEVRALGDFLEPAGTGAPFDLHSIPPGETSRMELTFAKSDLPQAPRIHPPGWPLPGCSEEQSWSGGATVRWRETGVFEPTADHRDQATLAVCPGGGPSYIGITLDCGDPAGMIWSIDSTCSPWTAGLLADSSGVPGGPAPDPIPPGTFSGWIAISADPSVTPWVPCEMELLLACGADRLRVLLTGMPCACQEPNDAPFVERSVALRLGPGVPNPFQLQTRIDYEVPSTAHASIRVYDVSGRLIRTLRDAPGAIGGHVVRWNGRDESGDRVSAGFYLCRLEQGSHTLTRKLILLR